jgi:hypothetical protein
MVALTSAIKTRVALLQSRSWMRSLLRHRQLALRRRDDCDSDDNGWEDGRNTLTAFAPAMPAYRFVIHKDGRYPSEGLGVVELADVAEAITFGKWVIQEMGHKDAYHGWTLEILEVKHAVGDVLAHVEPKK